LATDFPGAVRPSSVRSWKNVGRVAKTLAGRVDALSLLSERRRVLYLAAALFAVVFGLRLAYANPQLGISFLYVAPIVLLSMAFGARGAFWAIALSMLLTVASAALKHVAVPPLGYLIRSVVFAFVGATAAVFRGISLNLTEQSSAWFEQDIDLHCIANSDGMFVRVNDAFVRTLGYSKEDLISRPFTEFVHPDDRERTVAETIKLANSMGKTVDFENRYLTADGNYHWLRWSATPVHGGLIYASARDVTSQKEFEYRLEQLAATDSLTGLPNRRRFEQDAQRTLEHITRYGHRAALLMMDLDGFKAVNDTVGHHAGDEVLKCVGSRISTRLRSSDLVARLGGDEFVVLLPESGMPEVGLIAETLMERIKQCSWRQDGVDLPVAGTIGIALFESTSPETLSNLVRRADQAMLEAKREGGDRYRVDARRVSFRA
jgi:diguanylate cyclase (GGDEF)-like protein/PAS domain S-box-containing protein